MNSIYSEINNPKFIFRVILLLCIAATCDCFGQNNQVLRIQSIPQIYIQPEIEIQDENSLGILSGSCWNVISACDQNVTYSDPEGQHEKTRVPFLESFYVVNEIGEFLHIYSDPAPNLQNVTLSSAAVDKGWIRKNSVLLWKHCLLTKPTKQNIQAMTYQYSDFLDATSSGESNQDGIVVYNGPELKIKRPQKTKAKEIYYVYKIDENAILIGNANRIPSGTVPKEILIGWVPVNYCYQLDTRIWIARNNKPEATDEMIKSNIIPCLFIDEHQADLFRTNQEFNRTYVIRPWDQDKSGNLSFPFPLVREKEGIFKVKVVENDFKAAYAPEKINGMVNTLFRKVILISANDLNNVISNISGTIEYSGEVNNREAIRKFLAGRYHEEYPDLQEEMINNLTIRQIFESLFWITNSTEPVLNLKLRKINDPELVNNRSLETIIRSLRSSLQELRRVADYSKEDIESTFLSNDIRYFWIDLNKFY